METNFNNYTSMFLSDLGHVVLLPKLGVEIWDSKRQLTFVVTGSRTIIIDGFNYGTNIVSIDKTTGEINSSSSKKEDVSLLLVEEFINEYNLHPLVVSYLRANPKDLCVINPNSTISVTPTKWLDVSQILKDKYEDESDDIKEGFVAGLLGVSMSKKFINEITNKK